MISGIDHIGICSKDTRVLADWYVKNLGAKIIADNGDGGYFLAFEKGSMIEIFKALDLNGKNEEKTAGLRHLAFYVEKDNFDRVVTRLKAACDVEEIHDVAENEKGVKTYWFRDIEGNILHLVYRPLPLAIN